MKWPVIPATVIALAAPTLLLASAGAQAASPGYVIGRSPPKGPFQPPIVAPAPVKPSPPPGIHPLGVPAPASSPGQGAVGRSGGGRLTPGSAMEGLD
jgi:hypothetical protein